MKIERINENQIRCTLTSFDLSVRNLNLGELAYGSERARSLFREMIQKASNEVGFEAEDIPLMVEAIPLSNESIMLVITKIEDPEELDTRFSKFSPQSDYDHESSFNDLASELLEGADGLLKFLEDDQEKNLPEFLEVSSPKIPEEEKTSPDTVRIFSFDSLDRVCEAAQIAGQICRQVNSLYKRSDNLKYFLVIRNTQAESKVFNQVCNLLSEYGTKVKSEYATEAYYQEHYEVIVKDRALQALQGL